MSGRWEPGTVATILVDGNETTGLATGDGWMYSDSAGAGHLTFRQVDVVHPMIVLDLAPHDVMRTVEALRESRGFIALQVADQIEAQTRAPKPAEPTGLGAVVRDHKGSLWVKWALTHRAERNWKGPDVGGDYRVYTDIGAVEVLSEGVSP